MRKIIQITASAMVLNREEFSENIYALCDDGSVWISYSDTSEFGWKKCKDIPQD